MCTCCSADIKHGDKSSTVSLGASVLDSGATLIILCFVVYFVVLNINLLNTHSSYLVLKAERMVFDVLYLL